MPKTVPLLIGLVAACGLLWLVVGGGDAGPGDEYGPGDGAGPDVEGPILVGSERVPDTPLVTNDDTSSDTSPGRPSPDDELVIRGRVLDVSRYPVAGAEVSVHLDGNEALRGTTDADGGYTIDVGKRPTGWVIGVVKAIAEGPRAGRSGVTVHAASPLVIPVAPVIVGPAHEIDVRVVRDDVAVPAARVVLAYTVFGRTTPVSDGLTNADGVFHAGLVPEGAVQAFAAAAGHGRCSATIAVPRPEEGPVVLALTEERLLTVTVIDKATEQPVADAEVSVGDRFALYSGGRLSLLPPVEIPRTDSAGRTTVRGLGTEDALNVVAWKEGYARPNPFTSSGRIRAAPQQRDVVVPLSGYREVSFPIDVGAVAPPEEGATLEIEFQSWVQQITDERAGAAIEHGELVVRGLPNMWITGRVVSSEGTWARFTAKQNSDRGAVVSFALEREVRVRVVDAGGKPLVGRSLRYQGGFQFGSNGVPITDADGEAEFLGVTADNISVFLMAAGQTIGGHPIGQLDLTQEQSPYVLTVEPESELELRLRLDGAPGLPREYTLDIGRVRQSAGEVEEDPDAGVLIARHRIADSGKPVTVTLRAEGYLVAEGTIAGGGSESLTLDLTAAGALIAYVDPPEDGVSSVIAQVWNEASAQWETARPSGPLRPASPPPGAGNNADDGVRRFDGLPAGRYRAFDRQSRAASDAVEVRLGGQASEVRLDLSQSVWVEGTVLAPEGTRLRQVRVQRPGDTGPFSGERVDNAGHFKFRAPRGQQLELRPSHPVLSPAAQGGTAKIVVGATGPVTLRLEIGNTLAFRLPDRGDGRASGAGVALYAEASMETVVLTARAQADDGVFRIGGFAPGRYTIWIDAYRGTPIVIKGKSLGNGETDLGLLAPRDGSAIVVKFLTKPGASRPRVFALVTHPGPPAYSRSGVSAPDAKGDLVVTGLLAGTVSVRVNVLGGAGTMGASNGPTHEVTVDGSVDAVLEIDLR